MKLSQLLTQLEGPGGHEVKKRKARQRKKKKQSYARRKEINERKFGLVETSICGLKVLNIF